MSTQRFVAQAAAIALILAGCAACTQAQRAADSAGGAAAPVASAPIVKVGQGEVQGAAADGVAAFKELPYAAPWAQFAKTGDPDSAGGPLWLKFDAADENVMEFPANCVPVVAKHFHKNRLDWVEAGLTK
jgi:hypothetical protein